MEQCSDIGDRGDPGGMIVARALCKSYYAGGEATHVLRSVSLSVASSEVLFLVGPSGSGKSTLLSILGCVLTPDSGTLRILGREIVGLSASELARFRLQNIGFIFQQFHLFAGLTAADNVQVPLDLLRIDRSLGKRRSRDLLEAVGLADKCDMDVRRLSVGQRQRVAIARALVSSPKVVFADEPTASLDAESGQTTMELLRRLAKDKETAVVVVTHDSRILGYADRTVRISDGQLLNEAASSALPESLRPVVSSENSNHV